jgi:hypothetical protein
VRAEITNCHFDREHTSLILGDKIYVDLSVKTPVQNMWNKSDDAFQMVFRNVNTKVLENCNCHTQQCTVAA